MAQDFITSPVSPLSLGSPIYSEPPSFSLFVGDALASELTATNQNGTIIDARGFLRTNTSNTPRITYDGEGNFRGLLAEVATTQTALNSKDWDFSTGRGANIVKSGTVDDSSGDDVAPVFYSQGTSGANWMNGGNQDVSSGDKYSYQTKIRRVGSTEGNQYFVLGYREDGGFTQRSGVNVDLANGTVAEVGSGTTTTIDSVTIETVGDYYLIKVNGAAIDEATYPTIVFESGFASSHSGWVTGSSIGDGTGGIALCDFQFELRDVCSTYVESDGSTVTRTTDDYTFKQDRIDWSEVKAFYLEVELDKVDGANHTLVEIRDAANDTNERLTLRVNSANKLLLELYRGTTQAYDDTHAFTEGQKNKIFVRIEENNVAMFVNGTRIFEDTNALIAAFANLYLTQPSWDGWYLNGTMAQFQTFNYETTDEFGELITT